MPKKPLQWHPVAGGEIPACGKCFEYMRQPFLMEACASVGIEHGKTTDRMIRDVVNAYHAANHT